MWLLFFNLLLGSTLKGTVSLPTIETNLPSPTNTLATGYLGLIVTAQFEKENLKSYQWINTYADNSDVSQFHVQGAGCVPRQSINENITCAENNGVITSNLTYLQPLTTNLDLSVRSGNPNGGDISNLQVVVALPSEIIIQNCPHTLENEDNVTVQSNSAGYNDVGTFTCSNNGRLFYSNGSQPTSNRTTCQYDAEWSGQDNLQCWTAPNPVMTTINGNFTVVEGTDFIVTCEYNDVIPIGTNTAFYLDGNEVGRQQDRLFTFSLRAEDNNKQVSCHAVTPYTELFMESGRSPNYTVNVQYISPNVFNTIFASKYLIDTSSGYLLRSDQNLSMNCSSQGNPTPQCAFTICSGYCENTTNTNNECFISQPLSVGGSLSCLAVNNAGSHRSTTRNIAVIPVIRNVTISYAEKNETTAIERGEALKLTCSISYAFKLNTIFTWTHPNMITYPSAVLNLPSLSPFDTGKYTCKADDVFGKFLNSIYIDVIYAPFQNNPFSCSWVFGQRGSCNVTFMSNPPADFLALMKCNSDVKMEDENLSTDGIFQTFTFTKANVTMKDNGTYILYLQSSIKPYNHTIKFDVIVEENSSDGPSFNNTLMIVIATSGTAVIILLIAVIVFYCKRRKASENTKRDGTNNVVYAVEDENGYVDFRPSFKKPDPPKESASSHYRTLVQGTEEHGYAEINPHSTTRKSYQNVVVKDNGPSNSYNYVNFDQNTENNNGYIQMTVQTAKNTALQKEGEYETMKSQQ